MIINNYICVEVTHDNTINDDATFDYSCFNDIKESFSYGIINSLKHGLLLL